MTMTNHETPAEVLADARKIDSDSKAIIVFMAVAFTFILLGGLVDAWRKRADITYICHGDLIANTKTKVYECMPKRAAQAERGSEYET